MPNNSENFYNRLAFLYPIIDLFLKPQKRQFFKLVSSYPSGHLLEIGVGNGTHLKYYKTHEVTGIDTSKRMLAVSQKHMQGNVQLHCMDGEALEFEDNTFDYVVLSHVITVVQDPEKLLEEVYRVLKPKGHVFILNHFTPNNILKYVDQAFKAISKVFHFKSMFRMSDLHTIARFKLSHEYAAGFFSYFKIMIYEKES